MTRSLNLFLVYTLPLILLASFLWLSFDILVHGLAALDFSFILNEPMNSGREGGVAPILFSTFLIVAIALFITIPLGLFTAYFLSIKNNRTLIAWMNSGVDVLASVPSIVFGLFGNLVFCKMLGFGFSILSGGLTLACMALPIFIKTSLEGFNQIDQQQKLNAKGLNLNELTQFRFIFLPQALMQILAGLALSVGRAIAETAALIFTSGYVDRFPESLLDSGRSLSIHIYDLAMNVPGGNTNAYKSAFLLLVMILLINFISMKLLEKVIGQKQ